MYLGFSRNSAEEARVAKAQPHEKRVDEVRAIKRDQIIQSLHSHGKVSFYTKELGCNSGF